MQSTKRIGTSVMLFIAASVAFAAPPKVLITHNETDFESNGYIAGTIPSQHPTKAHSTGRVMWASVRMACFGHVINGRCEALIKIATDTDHPIELGTVSVDLNTGDIQPKALYANGYKMIVNGPAESTLSKE